MQGHYNLTHKIRRNSLWQMHKTIERLQFSRIYLHHQVENIYIYIWTHEIIYLNNSNSLVNIK